MYQQCLSLCCYNWVSVHLHCPQFVFLQVTRHFVLLRPSHCTSTLQDFLLIWIHGRDNRILIASHEFSCWSERRRVGTLIGNYVVKGHLHSSEFSVAPRKERHSILVSSSLAGVPRAVVTVKVKDLVQQWHKNHRCLFNDVISIETIQHRLIDAKGNE
jgi:hypothetical protein